MNGRLDEKTLCQMLNDQSDKFGRAITSLDAIEATLQNEGWSDPVHEALHALTRKLANDTSCAEVARHWNQSQDNGSQQLKQTIDRTRSTLKRLLEKVDSVESVARRLKDSLMPRIDQGIRARDAIDIGKRRITPTQATPSRADATSEL